MNSSQREQFHRDFETALSFVTRLHAAQTRKGTDIPYLAHLLGVAAIVLEHGGDRDEAIAALLHDAIEDQSANYPGGADGLRAEIRERFGNRVLSIVEGCTDADTQPKPPWRARKARYIAQIAGSDASTRLVACADKLHNARAVVDDLRLLGDALFDRFRGGKEGTLWYYRTLADTFRGLGERRLSHELERTVREMERLAAE